LWTTTIGNGLIKQMMGYRQSMPKIGLNLCPEFVDHYTLPFLKRLCPIASYLVACFTNLY
ncbi:hypothetical protein KW454_19980, partial [Vibrio fluvialis]|nr:hypothetical protein [Vibrio fluvialis]